MSRRYTGSRSIPDILTNISMLRTANSLLTRTLSLYTAILSLTDLATFISIGSNLLFWRRRNEDYRRGGSGGIHDPLPRLIKEGDHKADKCGCDAEEHHDPGYGSRPGYLRQLESVQYVHGQTVNPQ